MKRKNLILGAVAAVIFLVAVVYYVTHSGAGAEIPKTIKANCACLVCRQAVRIEAALTQPQPYECPECGERAVYPVLICRDCGKYFVPNLERRPPVEGIEEERLPKMPIMPSCPACGSRNVGSYIGDEPIPEDELVLPEWP